MRCPHPPPWRFTRLASLLAFCAGLGGAVFGQDPQQPGFPKEVAARVNGKNLLWKDVEAELKATHAEKRWKEFRQETLRQMVDDLLIRQFAGQKQLEVSEEDLDEKLQDDVTLYGGLEEFEKAIRFTHKTPTRYRARKSSDLLLSKIYGLILRSQAAGTGFEDLRLKPIANSEADLRNYYDTHPEEFEACERVWLDRIALTFATDHEEAAKREFAESLVRKLDLGAEFLVLAHFYSDIRPAKHYRDRKVTRKDLVGQYTEDTIGFLFDELKEREVSPIIRDGNTLNIFKVDCKITRKAKTLEQAGDRIRTLLEEQVHRENTERVRRWLRKKATIVPADVFAEGGAND